MKIKSRLTIYGLIGGFFLLLDQVLKYLARDNQDFVYYLGTRFLGWEYYPNTGIAFSLPFPNWLLVVVTPILITLLVFWVLQKKKILLTTYIGLFLIIAGALSNFIDRLFFAVTVDYLRVFTGVINLADILIVVGVGLLILGECKFKIGD